MAVRLALDTNAYSALRRKDRGVRELLSTAEAVALPLMVVGELQAGFALGNQRAKNQLVLDGFLSQASARVLVPDEDTARHYAALIAQLRTAGTPIPTNDIWIAALVLQHGYALATRDTHFRRIPQLALAHWE